MMGYENIHVIFQLTEKTNVHSVNALSKCSLCVWQNDRGRGQNKRKWDIKTNKDFNFYISNYNVIESLDHLIYSFKLFYNGWKFWHAPMQHGMAMAMVAVFSMYQECCEGKLDANWFIIETERLNSRAFRIKLSEHKLKYRLQNCEYPGGTFFWKATHREQKEAPRQMQ